jgi:hypothetical protein
MGQEILDETDKFADNTRTVEVNEETRWVSGAVCYVVQQQYEAVNLPGNASRQ